MRASRYEADTKNDAPIGSKRPSNSGRSLLLEIALNVLVLSLVLLAVFLFLLPYVPHAKLTLFLDAAATDPAGAGNLTHPAKEGIAALISRLPFFSIMFAAFAVTLALVKSRLRDFLLEIPKEWPKIRESLQKSSALTKERRIEIATVLMVGAVGVFLRVLHLGRAVHYDEADTYFRFASRPLYRALSYYPYPNNHLLHTLFVHLSIRIFPDTRWALRLPALVSGCVAIPMCWLTGRLLYGRTAGIFSAAWVATLPPFVEYSINARGYSLQWVLILTMMCCAVVLHNEPSLRTVWLGFILACVAGFYVIPTMILPISGTIIWMLLSAIADREGRLWDLLKRLVWAGLAMALLSAVLYFPPLLSSGPAKVLANPYVTSAKAPFIEELGLLGESVWARWFEGIPAGTIVLMALGLAIGLLWHRRLSNYRVPMTVIVFSCSFLFAWLHNVVGYPRVWIYLLLVGVITASAGLSLLVETIAGNSGTRKLVFAGTASVLLATSIGASLIGHRTLFRSDETLALPDAVQIADFLVKQIHPGDGLIIGPFADQMLKYELLQRNRKLYGSLMPAKSAQQVIVVSLKPATLLEFLSGGEPHRGPKYLEENATGPVWAEHQLDPDMFGPAELKARFPSVEVYAFERKSTSTLR